MHDDHILSPKNNWAVDVMVVRWVNELLAVCRKYSSTITACLLLNKKMEVVKEMAAKLHVDVKSLLTSCLPHILVYILPLSAAAAADQQAKMTTVGFECYSMLTAELGRQVVRWFHQHCHLFIFIVQCYVHSTSPPLLPFLFCFCILLVYFLFFSSQKTVHTLSVHVIVIILFELLCSSDQFTVFSI